MKSLILAVSAILPVLISCNSNNNYIKHHQWKYGKGLWLKHDVLCFNSMKLYLRDDTIFEFGAPLAIVTKTVEPAAGFTELHIRSMITNETGIYYDLGPLKKQ